MPPRVPASGSKPCGGKNCGVNKGCFDASLSSYRVRFLILIGHFGFLWRLPLTTRSQTFVPRFSNIHRSSWLLHPLDCDFLVRKPVCKTLKMTTAQVVETSVTVDSNSPIQDYVHPNDHTQATYEAVSLVFTGTVSISMRFLLCYTA